MRARTVLFALILVLVSTIAAPETFQARVIRVLDGDTLEVLDAENRTLRIRLAGVDAPETGQDYGTKAKRHLLDLAGSQVVQVESNKRDKYGRLVGKIIADGKDVNLAMVQAGFAWWYRKYAVEQTRCFTNTQRVLRRPNA